jgi:hypothetical protein
MLFVNREDAKRAKLAGVLVLDSVLSLIPPPAAASLSQPTL